MTVIIIPWWEILRIVMTVFVPIWISLLMLHLTRAWCRTNPSQRNVTISVCLFTIVSLSLAWFLWLVPIGFQSEYLWVILTVAFFFSFVEPMGWCCWLITYTFHRMLRRVLSLKPETADLLTKRGFL